MKPKTHLRSDLASVRRALHAWRKNRPHPRQPIPPSLWNELAGLAREHGVSAISRALRLDYYALKRQVAQAPAVPQFFELPVARFGDLPPCCTAELLDAQGRKLVLRWCSAPGPELLGVVQAFWNQEA